MKGVELYAQVRFAVRIEGVSRREAARRYGIDPRTVAKMLAFSVPPGARYSCRCGTILAMRRLILVRRMRRSPGANARCTFLRWGFAAQRRVLVRAYLVETAEHNA